MARSRTITEEGLVPRAYIAQGVYGDESVVLAIQEQLDAIHALGGKIVDVTFQSPMKAVLIAYVPPTEAEGRAADNEDG